MDIQTLTAETLTFLSPYFSSAGMGAARKGGEKLGEAIYKTIARKISKDKDEKAIVVLEQIKSDPTNQDIRSNFEDLISNMLASDPQLSRQIALLISESEQTTFTTEVRDDAQVGKIINVNKVDDLHIE